MKRLLSWLRGSFFRMTSFALGAVFAAGLVTMFAAQAVDEYGIFELDGNVEGNGPGLPDDWQEVYEGNSSAAKVLFIPVSDGMGGGEGPAYDRSHLTQGTKDIDDLLDWVIDPGDVANAKAEILNAFAAAYLAPVNGGGNHFVTYFGFDREANEGTANGSFWLLRQRTEIVQIAGQDTPDNPDDDQFSFNRSHSDGDILLATDYVKGGKEPITYAFMWQGGADGSLVQLGGASAACPGDGSGGHPEPYCAITNSGGEMVPWPFPGKNLAMEGYYDELMLLEGGVDLTELLGDDVGCFATFIAGTRTSAPPTASLKDIAIGEFDTCSITVDKSGDELAKVGADPADSAMYTIVIKNDGLVTLYKQSIVDSLMGDLTDGSNGYIQSNTCGDALAAGESCTIELDYPIPAGTPIGNLNNKVSVVYDHRSTLDGDERSADSEWDVLVFEPSVDLTKQGDIDLAMAGDTVTYTVMIDNTSSDGTPALLLQSLTDTLAGDLTDMANYTSSTCGGSLALGTGCEVVYPYLIPADTGADAVIHNVAEVHYTPGDQFSNDITDSDYHDVVIFDPDLEIVKECPIVLNPDGSEDVWTAGETRDFTFTLTNLSDDDSPVLVLKSLTDALLGGDISSYLPADATELAYGESHTFSIPYTPSDADADAGGVDNTVNAVFTVSYNGKMVDVSDDDIVRCPVVPPAPARLILEKELIGGQGLEFRFLVNGPDGLVAAEALTPTAPSPDYVQSGEITLSTVFGTATLYSAEELLDAANMPADAEFVSLSCTENGSGIPGSISGAVATLEADEDDVFVCRWVNRLPGYIIVNKVTDPAGSAQQFEFATTYGANFYLADGGSNNSGPLANGTYSVDEMVPAGWELKNVMCDSSLGGMEDHGAIDLTDGETVTCTFYNQQDANIIVRKETDPDGSTQLFDFSSDFSGAFQLADGGMKDSGDLDPGTYAVSETVPSGWELTSATCDDGSDPAAIGLQAGETVTCTFYNEQDAYIIVRKETDPDGATQLFDFSSDFAGLFQLADGGSKTSDPLDPGTYAVSETVPGGWELTSATCDDGSDPAAIGLIAGETVTCTFYNMQLGDESCTPGYWKQPQHFGSWYGYSMSDDYESVFDVSLSNGLHKQVGNADGTITLLEALEAEGNDLNQALLRHSTAALLNAASLEVAYPVSTSYVKALVKAAWEGDSAAREAAHNELASYNELYDCPLSRNEL